MNRRQLLGAGMALPLGAMAGSASAAESCAVTPQQTTGPFYPVFEQVDKDVDLWQADSNGRYGHPADPNPARPDANFQGWGQTVTDAEGRFSFKTIKPASYPMEFLADGKPDKDAGHRTPHIHFRASRRGYVELATQMYFAGEKLNDVDIVLKRVPAVDWPKVIISSDKSGTDGIPVFQFDITIARA